MFRENFEIVKNEFSQAMNLDAGKGVKVSTVFDAIEALENGRYNTLQEMYKAYNFGQQNQVFKAVNVMLTNLGTPVSSLTKGTKKKKLSGNEFALSLLQKNGLNLPSKKVKSEETEDTVSL